MRILGEFFRNLLKHILNGQLNIQSHNLAFKMFMDQIL